MKPSASLSSSLGRQALSRYPSSPSPSFDRHPIRTPTAAELSAEEKRFRTESDESMTRFMEWGFIVPSESSLGAQKVSLRSSSPAFSFSQEPRLAHNTTRVPRGLMGYDHRPITEYKYDIPGSMSKQLESTRPTSPTFTFSSLDRMIPGKLEPIKGVGDKSPLPVSPSLYNPDRIRRTPPSSPGDTQLPCSPILSAMGEQVSSLKATRPRTVFGSSRKLPPTKPVVCDKLYNTSEAATHVLPRPATVTCNVKGRPGLHDRKVPGQDYDFMPSDSPGCTKYDVSTAARHTMKSSPSFSMGSPKPLEAREKNGRVPSHNIFRF